MTERDDHLSEGFLVDGIAPSVIGADSGADPVGEVYDYQPGTRREPPTTPIRAQGPQDRPDGQQSAEQRKGWLGRMFNRP